MGKFSKEKEFMNKVYNVRNLKFSGDRMFITIDNEDYIIPLADTSLKLLNAGQLERERFTVSASGYGISWDLIDEDLSIKGLLKFKSNSDLYAADNKEQYPFL